MSEKQDIARRRNWGKRRLSASYEHARTALDVGGTERERTRLGYVQEWLELVLKEWDENTKLVIAGKV